MHTSTLFRLLLTAAVAVCAPVFAQGPLAPPVGPPAASMKTLDEIHAAVISTADVRTPVNATTCPPDATYTHVISTPGSYYLPAGITAAAGKGGIRITAERVTLDLNGFSITGTTGNIGLSIEGANATVRNGFLKTWATHGVSGSQFGTTLTDLKVSNVTGRGIDLGGKGCLVEGCMVRTAQRGITAAGNASICRNCTVDDIDAAEVTYGIWSVVVVDCAVTDLVSTAAPGNGITAAILGETVSRCNVRGPISGAGVVNYINGDTVEDCAVSTSSAPASSGNACTGITGNVVSRCHIDHFIGNTTSAISGIEAVRVSDCVVQAVSNTGSGLAYGIEANSLATTPTRSGFVDIMSVTGCVVSGIETTGIYTSGSAVVTGCRVSSCGTYGIDLANGTARDNHTSNSSTGLRIATAGLATGNYSQGDTTGYSFGASVRAGSILTTGGTGAFDPTANIDL
jgi:hypothetical protein